jgi:hypothetical protein
MHHLHPDLIKKLHLPELESLTALKKKCYLLPLAKEEKSLEDRTLTAKKKTRRSRKCKKNNPDFTYNTNIKC